MRRRRKPNVYTFGEIAVMPTRFGTLVFDAIDLPAMSEFSWHVRLGECNYVRAWLTRGRGPKKFVYLHDFLLKPDAGTEVDFKNGNGLDCRRSNMRIADRTENCCNRRVATSNSGFLGVHWDKARGKWLAQIKFRGKHKFIGRFDDLLDAVQTRDEVAAELHGEFASTLNQELLEQGA